ncbi:MAG: cobalamin-dependent protein [Candidatus Lokiarchaeota archaeon]|nr:cobalamin-dependent protein [Candidatus Lokiarchaeota archaeon]
MDLKKITELVIDLEVDEIESAVSEAIHKDGKNPYEVLEALTRGMDEVGKLYEEKEYYLNELVLAGETMKEAFKILKPILKSSGDSSNKSKVIVATVKGDNHDIGKNILSSLLLSSGFEIYDLGMDCDEKKVIEAVKETGARVVALSTLLTTTVEQVGVVHEALKASGLRDKVKIIVGGAALNMELAKEMGADDYGEDAMEGVKRIKKMISN